MLSTFQNSRCGRLTLLSHGDGGGWVGGWRGHKFELSTD